MESLNDIIVGAKNIVFFGGAGVSTESGIPDFRSESGLYKAKLEYGRSPEALISYSAFVSEPELFFSYYKGNLIFPDARPNDAHKALAKFERDGKLSAVVTQNIDGLHQMAGSQNVHELHGSVHRNYCLSCDAKFGLEYILDEGNCGAGKAGAGGKGGGAGKAGADGKGGGAGSPAEKPSAIPRCNICGGIVRPDVVLYEEALDDRVVTAAVSAISKADTLIVGGTSLVVYPAAGYLEYFRGDNLVLINKSETGYDKKATLVIHKPIGKVLSEFL